MSMKDLATELLFTMYSFRALFVRSFQSNKTAINRTLSKGEISLTDSFSLKEDSVH